jgi:cysteine desulfurase/selenocysteine lyase
MEHHSNIVPWQMLCEERGCILKIIPMNDQGEIIQEEYEKLLNKKTKLVSLVYVSNSLGTINPIKTMLEKAHSVGAKTLVDAAQAVATLPISVKDLDCDFMAFSSHKLFGPTGVGVLYGKESLLNEMPPYQGGGDMILSVTFEKTIYNSLPYKFEAGTPAIAEVIGFGAAIDYISSFNFEDIQAHEKYLLKYGTEVLSLIKGLNLIGTASHKVPTLSFVLEGIHAHDIGTLLDQYGIAVRVGHHCTQPIMKHFGIAATSRASLSIYNTKDDLDLLTQGILKVQEVFR